MEPLIVLTVVTLSVRGAGAAGAARLASWRVALRGGLAAMFVLTGVAHFVGMRAEMIDMVPPALPAPELLVTLTGLLELAGAAGLLWSRTAPWAAGGLAALLVAMFPANVYAAVAGVTTGAMDHLLPRTLLQVVFVGAAVVVASPLFERGHAGRDEGHTVRTTATQ
jgi:uncharacterized membrane protein